MSDRIAVSAAELVRNFGHWQAKALHAPLAITHHGRERLVLVAADQYAETGPILVTDVADAHSEFATSLSAVLDNLDLGFIALDADLKIQRVNHVVEAFLGEGRAHIEGRALTDLSPSLDGSVLVDQIRRVLRTGEEVEFETDSLVFEARLLGVRVFPYPHGVALLFTNLTDRELTNDALQDWAAAKAALNAHPRVAFARLDGRGRFTFADETFQKQTGFGERELCSCRLFDIVANADRRPVQKAFEDVLRTRTAVDLTAKFVVRSLEERELQLSLGAIVSGFAESGAYLVATDC